MSAAFKKGEDRDGIHNSFVDNFTTNKKDLKRILWNTGEWGIPVCN
jgi:hypothetical protein